MSHLNYLEDYFVKIYKSYGIAHIKFRDNRIELDDRVIRNMVFSSDDFNTEFENLLEHCCLVHRELQRNFSLKIKRDMNNDHFVLVA